MLRILRDYSGALLSGATTTLELALIVWIAGLALGVLLGAIRGSLPLPLRNGSTVLFAAASSVPILVYLLWFHYPIQAAFGVVVNPFLTSAFVLSIYTLW